MKFKLLVGEHVHYGVKHVAGKNDIVKSHKDLTKIFVNKFAKVYDGSEGVEVLESVGDPVLPIPDEEKEGGVASEVDDGGGSEKPPSPDTSQKKELKTKSKPKPKGDDVTGEFLLAGRANLSVYKRTLKVGVRYTVIDPEDGEVLKNKLKLKEVKKFLKIYSED